MIENNILNQIDTLSEAERRQALSDRLKEISDRIAAISKETVESGPIVANVANTCPTDPAELAMCDSCQ